MVVNCYLTTDEFCAKTGSKQNFQIKWQKKIVICAPEVTGKVNIAL